MAAARVGGILEGDMSEKEPETPNDTSKEVAEKLREIGDLLRRGADIIENLWN